MRKIVLACLFSLRSAVAVALFLCFAFGLWLQRAAQAPADVDYYRERLQEAVSAQEAEVLGLFSNGAFILNAVDGLFTPDTLAVYEARSYTISIYDERDSLIFWSNNKAAPYRTDVEPSDSLVNLPYRIQNSDYLFLKETYRPIINGKEFSYTLVALIPVFERFSLQNAHLSDNFSLLSTEVARYVEAVEEPTQQAIRNNRGEAILHLRAKAGVVHRAWAAWAIIFYLLGSGLALGLLYDYSARLARRTGRFLYGFGLLMGLSAVARGLVTWAEFPSVARTFGIFSEGFTKLPHWWSHSLGEFVLDVGLILVWALFVHREFRLFHWRNWGLLGRLVGGFLLYSLMLEEFLMFRLLLANIIRDSSISFQFDNLSRINLSSFLALAGILGVSLSIFVSNYKLLRIFKQLGFVFSHRIAMFSVALGVQVGLWFLGGASVELVLQTLLFAASFIGLLSIFVNRKNFNLAWLSLWLMYFSVLGMLVFAWDVEAKNQREYREFVELLAAERDGNLEQRFAEVEKAILEDDFFKSFFTTATFISRKQAIERLMFRYLDNYFFGRYDYNVAFYNDKGALYKGEQRSYDEFVSTLNKSETINNNLYFYSDWEGRYTYIARLPIYSNDVLQGLIVIELLPKPTTNKGNAFVELLQMPKNKQERLVTEYEFALYKKDRRVWHNGSSLPLTLAYNFRTPAPREAMNVDIKGERYLMYRAGNNNLGIVHLRVISAQQMLTIFAYIFCIGVLLLGFVALLLLWLWRLTGFSLLQWEFDQSLRERIQLGIVLVSIFSFVAIALITILYFSNEYADYHDANLNNRVKSTGQFASMQVQSNFDSFYVLPDVNKLSEISRLDVNIYDLSGTLLRSSSDNVFERRLISRQMNPLALYALRQEQNTQFIHRERISQFRYLSAYVMLRDNCDVPIAYLNLPYDAESGNTARAQEIAQFLGALLNVYVFFLILASGAALLIARSITYPLLIIADKLRQVKLDKQNEPLEWHIRDEIGDIVQRYNQMIIDLETNKQALERNQRESAWRDMAKQVAHEIKNPLTPMKLNIQLLRRLFDSDPQKAKAKIERISDAIVEQIDNLAAIASEFSAFAQMPAPNNERIPLAQLIDSVLLLFNPEQNIVLSRNLPDESTNCCVFADKNQLLRVLNNLIKNAIQAMPEDREGRVQVSLMCTHDTAIIRVEDNGCGIPESRKQQIFTPYFTSKSSGTGIGLSMCKSIVTMAKGRIYFDSTEGEGTTFTVELPLLQG